MRVRLNPGSVFQWKAWTSIAPLLFAVLARGETVEKSTSTSRQFVVYGADIYLRGAIAQLAEQTKSDALRWLQLRDDWKTPILINLQEPQPNVPEIPEVALNFSQTGFGLKLQLDLLVGPEIQPTVVQRELLRATLLEISYRQIPNLAPGMSYVAAPDWLLEGLLIGSANKTPLTDALQSAVNGGRVMPLRDFLQQRRNLLDGESRALFRAYSYAMVEMLGAQPDGHARLARVITDLPRASNDPIADLGLHFPGLKGDAGAEKTWQSSVKRIAQRYDGGPQSFLATEKAIDELMKLPVAESRETKALLTLRECAIAGARFTPRKPALAVLRQQLTILGTQSHPLLRGLVGDLVQCAELVARGKQRELAQRFARAESDRQQLDQRMVQLDDYMNWFEATQLKTSSGAFTNYLHSAGSENNKTRHDGLSLYLDTIEQQGR